MKVLTPVGFARLIKRGIEATEHARFAALRVEYKRYSDMAMALCRLVEAGDVDKAGDAEFLDAVATELDSLANP